MLPTPAVGARAPASLGLLLTSRENRPSITCRCMSEAHGWVPSKKATAASAAPQGGHWAAVWQHAQSNESPARSPPAASVAVPGSSGAALPSPACGVHCPCTCACRHMTTRQQQPHLHTQALSQATARHPQQAMGKGAWCAAGAAQKVSACMAELAGPMLPCVWHVPSTVP
jgi:hypothetical protein